MSAIRKDMEAAFQAETEKVAGLTTRPSQLTINEAMVQAALKKGLRPEREPPRGRGCPRAKKTFRHQDGKPVAYAEAGKEKMYNGAGEPFSRSTTMWTGLIKSATAPSSTSPRGTGASGSGKGLPGLPQRPEPSGPRIASTCDRPARRRSRARIRPWLLQLKKATGKSGNI